MKQFTNITPYKMFIALDKTGSMGAEELEFLRNGISTMAQNLRGKNVNFYFYSVVGKHLKKSAPQLEAAGVGYTVERKCAYKDSAAPPKTVTISDQHCPNNDGHFQDVLDPSHSDHLAALDVLDKTTTITFEESAFFPLAPPLADGTGDRSPISITTDMSDSAFNASMARMAHILDPGTYDPNAALSVSSINEQGLCPLLRILHEEDPAKRVVYPGDRVAFMTTSDEEDGTLGAHCPAKEFRSKTIAADGTVTDIIDSSSPMSQFQPYSLFSAPDGPFFDKKSDHTYQDMIDIFINKADSLFTPEGYFVSTIVNPSKANEYTQFVDAVNQGRPTPRALMAELSISDYTAALGQIQDFLEVLNTGIYVAADMQAGEEITNVWVMRDSTPIYRSALGIMVSGNQITFLNPAVLQPGDKIWYLLEPIED